MSVNHFRSLSSEFVDFDSQEHLQLYSIGEYPHLDMVNTRPHPELDPMMPNITRMDSFDKINFEDLDLDNPLSNNVIDEVLDSLDNESIKSNAKSVSSPALPNMKEVTIGGGHGKSKAPPVSISYALRPPAPKCPVKRPRQGVAVKNGPTLDRSESPNSDSDSSVSIDSRATLKSARCKGSKKGNPTSRQAEYARNYRQKNRQFLDSLESKITQLTSDNKKLKRQKDKQAEDMNEMQNEIEYLRNVLANDSQIAGLLANVTNQQGLKLKFPTANQISAHPPPPKKSRESGVSAGVCVHVQEDGVSLEFCGKCNHHSRCVDTIH